MSKRVRPNWHWWLHGNKDIETDTVADSAYRYWWTGCVGTISRRGNRRHRPPSPIRSVENKTATDCSVVAPPVTHMQASHPVDSHQSSKLHQNHLRMQIWNLMLETVRRKRQLVVFLPFSAGQLATRKQKEERKGGRRRGRRASGDRRERKKTDTV